jgi:type II secretory pathway pseudopilin PulG
VPFVAGTATANVYEAGSPALGAVAGGVMVSVGADVTLTVTLPLAVPVVAGAAGAAGAPAAGGVVPPVLEPACAPTATVTVAVVVALRTAVATPFASVETATCSSVPAVVVNVTGAELSGLPLMSITVPAIVERPPVAGSRVGFAETRTLPTAAVPTATLATFELEVAELDPAPPEVAVMIAVPLAVPALNLTITRPPLVRASDGSIDPKVVVKVTTVPSWGAVPACSSTVAVMSVVPFTDSAVLPAVTVIVDPVGASNGTFWQAPILSERPARTAVAIQRRRGRDTMKAVSILVPMKLAGQARSQHGYAMAVLLVAMSIMAIMLTVVMPVWKQTAQREKEEELVFRGTQYVHAIALFQRKTANAYPPNIDLLVRERYLRKKYKDPITNDDFVPLPVGAAAGAATSGRDSQPGGRGGQTAPDGRGSPPSTPGNNPPNTTQGMGGRGSATPFGAPSAGTIGGISGVASKSKDQSIRIYNGRSHYNEWAFVYVQQQQAPGAGAAPGGAGPGGRGTTPAGAGGVGGVGPGGFGPQPGGFPRGATPIQPVTPSTPRGRF